MVSTHAILFKALNDIIKLRVPTRKEEHEKHYSYNQLSDLYDKLTLVVGKSQEHQNIIRYFEDVILDFFYDLV